MLTPPEPTLPHIIALLTRTPPTLAALLHNLPDPHANEGDSTWSPYDILGHLLHGDRTDWLPRVRTILEHGETSPFAPFDRTAQLNQPQDQPLNQLLDDFASLRAENLATLQSLHLQPEDLARRGTHPVFGSVTLAQLLATWAAHDLTHLHQLTRVLAHPYRAAVGPWSAYLGVLHCTGHSAS